MRETQQLKADRAYHEFATQISKEGARPCLGFENAGEEGSFSGQGHGEISPVLFDMTCGGAVRGPKCRFWDLATLIRMSQTEIRKKCACDLPEDR